MDITSSGLIGKLSLTRVRRQPLLGAVPKYMVHPVCGIRMTVMLLASQPEMEQIKVITKKPSVILSLYLLFYHLDRLQLYMCTMNTSQSWKKKRAKTGN